MTVQALGNASSQTFVSQTSSSRASFRQNFRGLENALLNGDLSGAQSAFASLQQLVSGAQGSANPKSILSQLGQSNSLLAQDMQALSSALSANDLSGAQKAFAKLQQDMESVGQANGASRAHHGHHAKGNDGDADDGVASSTQASFADALSTLLQSVSSSQSTGSSAKDLLDALQSLANSNPKVAGDLVTLMTDLNTVGNVVNTTG